MKKNRSLQQAARYASCAILLIFLSGCTQVTVHGVKPVSTGLPTLFTGTERVDSLQPELRWKGDVLKKYDLAVWNTILVDNRRQRRKIIYEKTGLSGTAHKVEIVLNPDSLYYWSVRETGSETWSTVTSHTIYGYGTWENETDMFKFFTPKTK